MSPKRLLPVVGLVLMAALAVGGFRLWQSWTGLGDTLAGVASARPARTGEASGTTAGGGFAPARGGPAGAFGASGAAADDGADALGDTTAAAPADVREQARELRQALRRELANDPELYASLDELLEEPDEAVLRENLELLHEAFLGEPPADSAD